jgi:hypothetical protein
MLPILRNLLFLHLVFIESCRPVLPHSDIDSFHKDQSGVSDLVDVGVYIDSQPTTTFGEIFSEEFRGSQWSGDQLIKRSDKGYSRLDHEAYSPTGIFYVKGKALKNELLPRPSKIEILEGESISLSSELFDRYSSETSGEGASEFDEAERARNANAQIYAMPLPANPSDIDERPRWAIPLSGSGCENLPKARHAFPIDSQDVAVLRARGGGVNQMNPIPSKDYTLCRFDDSVTDDDPHRPGMEVFILPVKQNVAGTIHVKIYWPKVGGGESIFNIRITNLHPLMDGYDDKSIDRYSLVPELQDCDAVSVCPKGSPTLRTEVSGICRQMNDLVSPVYSERQSAQYMEMRTKWQALYKSLTEKSSQCQEFTIYSSSKVYSTPKPSQFKIGRLHDLEIQYKWTTLDAEKYINIDLNFAKAVNTAFAGLGSVGVSGLNISSLCRNTKVSGTGRTSHHAYCSAMDISRVQKADDKKWHLITAYRRGGTDSTTQWLRGVRDHFCKYFTTVLGPDYDGAHANHFHIALHPHNSGHYDRQYPQYHQLASAPRGIGPVLTLTSFLPEDESEALHGMVDDSLYYETPITEHGGYSLSGRNKINTLCK